MVRITVCLTKFLLCVEISKLFLKKMIIVQLIENDTQLRTAFAIRQKVFVEEQQVDPQLEYDEFEKDSRHFLATVDHLPAGTARWRKTEDGIKLERFAVFPEFRNQGVGSALLIHVLKDVGRPEGKLIYLHAQNQVIPFYEKHGFEISGGEFEEAGILHHKMIYHP
jgi:predicted GNAT family N-acyltransferase